VALNGQVTCDQWGPLFRRTDMWGQTKKEYRRIKKREEQALTCGGKGQIHLSTHYLTAYRWKKEPNVTEDMNQNFYAIEENF
jgi:hypothetical protein